MLSEVAVLVYLNILIADHEDIKVFTAEFISIDYTVQGNTCLTFLFQRLWCNFTVAN